MNNNCDCCGTELNNNDGWRYYKQGNWYCKTNIRLPEPDPDDQSAYDDIIAFLPHSIYDSHAALMLHDHLEFYSEVYGMRDSVGDSDYSNRMTYEEQIIAFFLEFPEAKKELLPVKKDYSGPCPKPTDTYYYGFGCIKHWLDPMHLISYDSVSNRIYALTCLDPQESFLYSVLDAYTFWEYIDLYSLVTDLDLPDDAICRRGLLVDATQWLLGIWEPSGNVFGYNAASVDLLKEFDIDMFELNRQEKVAYAYFVNPGFYIDIDNFEITADKSDVKLNDRLIYGLDFHDDELEQSTIQEVVFRYADEESEGNYYFSPCTIDCPLVDMHVVADCLCKNGNMADETKYNEYDAAPQQIEIFERPGEFLANGCLTETGMVIYECSLII